MLHHPNECLYLQDDLLGCQKVSVCYTVHPSRDKWLNTLLVPSAGTGNIQVRRTLCFVIYARSPQKTSFSHFFSINKLDMVPYSRKLLSATAVSDISLILPESWVWCEVSTCRTLHRRPCNWHKKECDLEIQGNDDTQANLGWDVQNSHLSVRRSSG